MDGVSTVRLATPNIGIIVPVELRACRVRRLTNFVFNEGGQMTSRGTSQWISSMSLFPASTRKDRLLTTMQVTTD